MSPKSKRSLQDVVGKETYMVWMDMLRELVPDGRTHRLSVVVAGMLQYAIDKAVEIKHRNEEEHSVAMSLIDAAEAGYPEHIKELIHDVVDRLFKDAGVSYERISKRGDHIVLLMKPIMNFQAGLIIRGIEICSCHMGGNSNVVGKC